MKFRGNDKLSWIRQYTVLYVREYRHEFGCHLMMFSLFRYRGLLNLSLSVYLLLEGNVGVELQLVGASRVNSAFKQVRDGN